MSDMPVFVKGLVDQLRQAIATPKKTVVPEGSRILVHAAVSRFSVLYERIRNAVDYKDEHLLRKAAILRIFKRQLVVSGEADAIAHHLVRELIGAKYLPNGELPETLIGEVSQLVQKYIVIERAHVGSGKHLTWLQGVLAVEIEELLVDQTQQKALVTFLYERISERIRIQGMEVDETDRRLQTYLACHRTLLKADDEVLSYKLLRAYLPEWLRPADWIHDPYPMAERLIGVERRIKKSLSHSLSQKYIRVVRPWAVALNVLRDALLDKPEETMLLLEKPDMLEASVTRIAERRYAEAKKRLRRGAARATLYLFVTKMLVALAVEVPTELLLYSEIAPFALGVNLLFPPTLMFFVGLLIHVPGRDNTERIRSNVLSFLSADGLPVRDIRIRKTRGWASRFVLHLAYAITFVIIFGAVGMILRALEFTPVSTAIFIFFLCVVSFFAFRLRQNAREFVVVDGKDTLRSSFMDFLSLPILRAGQWLSRSISRINVFLFFFDFLFEAPFKMLLAVLEEWFAFLKEKKEELQ